MTDETATNPVLKSEASTTIPTEGSVEHVRLLTGFRHGALPLMVLLPPLVYYMWICVAYYGGDMQLPTTVAAWRLFLSHLTIPSGQAWAILGGWYALQIALQIWAPGKWVEGTKLRNGSRLRYKMNGWFSWWFTIGAAAALWYFKVLPGQLLAEYFGELLTIINVFAFGLSGYLYWYGRRWPAGESNAGKFIYDYFMGTALNPRIRTFDLKLFFEARPGLILWVLINFSFMALQYDRHGFVTIPMILVCAFHFFYVADYYYNEPRILSTMDIKHENFGWMLAWGDAAWVPFTYTLQTMYLVNHVHQLPIWGTVAIIALNAGGFFVFRSVNSQKDNFRSNPDALIWGKKPQFIKTELGTLLLLSGWWGKARHANYMGDLMMAWAWCLPCLFGHVIPYFYVIYFTWLLVHREWRDDKMCAAKYGKDWERYKQKVPWRIVPHIY